MARCSVRFFDETCTFPNRRCGQIPPRSIHVFVQRIESNNTPGWEQLKHSGSLFSACKRWKERERDDSFRSNRSQRRYAITRERDYVSLFLSPYPYLSLIIAWGYGAREAVSFPLSITVFSRGINVRLPHESGRTRFRLAIPRR